MYSALPLAIALLIATAAIAQQPAARTGTVEGTVTNSVTGEPVKKATVLLAAITAPNRPPSAGSSAITDASGHFTIANLAPGSYFPLATCPGFTFQAPHVRSVADVKLLTVGEDGHIKDVNLKLDPLGSLSGRVLDEDGDPIVHAQVEVLMYGFSQGKKQLRAISIVQTNDLGEYSSADLPPGRYYVRVSADAGLSYLPPLLRSSRPQEAFPATFFPNATTMDGATPVEVSTGARVAGVDFKLRKVRAFEVRGQIANLVKGQNNVDFQMHPEGLGVRNIGAVVQPDGSFVVRGVTSGAYVLRASQDPGRGRQSSASLKVDVGDHDVDGLVVELVPHIDVTGQFRIEGAAPGAAQANVGNVNMIALDESFSMGISADKDGAFKLVNLRPGRYRVDVNSSQPGTYVKAILLGPQDVSNGRVDLTHYAGTPLEIVLASGGGKIQGTVQNDRGDPAMGVLLSVAPRAEMADRGDLFKTSGSDPSGYFEFQDLAPGEYTVYAWEDFDYELLRSMDFLKQIEAKAGKARISPGGRETVQVKLITSAEITAAKGKLP